MAEGAVKWFHPVMGYGVIAPDDGSPVVLVNASAAEAARLGRLKKGDRLGYDPVRAANGRFQASNLRPVAGAAGAPARRPTTRGGGRA